MGKTKRSREDKASRRRLGKYYTPSWAVDYIVKHTLGLILKENTERPIGELAILDPACGDGAFLRGALRFLANSITIEEGYERRLTLRSLVDCIHGVDVDPGAISSCRKKLTKTATELLGFPADFTNRILLGDSLIQEDDDAIAVFGENLPERHPLVWQRVYPWVMRDGGFDVIIGNPPFIGVKMMDPQLKEYLRRKYTTAHQQFDILVAFIERGLQLLRGGGRLGFIISNKVLAADYGLPLRELLVSSLVIEQMVDISQLEMFEGAATYPHIIIIRKPLTSSEAKENETLLLSRLEVSESVIKPPSQTERVPQHFFRELPNCILSPALSKEKFRVLQKMQQDTTLLGQICKISCGIARTGFSKHILTKTQFNKISKEEKRITRPFLPTGGVHRYSTKKKGYLTYSADLATTDQWKEFGEPKIVFAGIGKQIRVALDQEGCALGRVYYSIPDRNPVDPNFLIALLNSRLVNAYYSLLFGATHLRGGYIRYNATYLQKIPVPALVEPKLEAELIELARQAIQKPALLKQGLDSLIDQHVANLYGLEQEEIDIFVG